MGGQQMGQSATNASRFFYGYFVVGISLIMMSTMWAVYYAFGVFFKTLLNEFGWTRAITSGAFSLAAIINGLLTIAMGGLTDRFGPRMVMTLCGLFLGAGCVLMSQTTAVWQLYLFYGLLVGAGMSGSFIPLLSTVARWFIKRRGMMTGIVAAGSGFGALFGPPWANYLISLYGWRTSYVILGSTVVIVLVISSRFIKRDPSEVDQFAYGADHVRQKELNFEVEGLSLKETVYTSQFWLFFGTGFCYGFCVFTIMIHIVPHALELGISTFSAANLLATVGAFSIIGKILLGRIGDVVGTRQTLMLSFMLMLAALIWLILSRRPWMLFSSAGLFGFAYGGCAVSHSPITAELFGLRSHGLIFGTFGVSVAIGGSMGPLFTGHLFDMSKTYQFAFVICAIISFTGITLAGLLKSSRKDKNLSDLSALNRVTINRTIFRDTPVE
jgi:MFS family permease